MKEMPISPLTAQAILGCEINCGWFRGSRLGCEYYTDEEIIDIVRKEISNENDHVFTCPDGVVQIKVKDAKSMIEDNNRNFSNIPPLDI